jgi:hypothetical protein
MPESNINNLVSQFLSLGHAEVGHGPSHPTHPNPALAPLISSFLEQYPLLRKDRGYVEFLDIYAGAHIC